MISSYQHFLFIKFISMKSFIKFIICWLILSIIISIIYFRFINNQVSCFKVLTGSMQPEIQVGENIIIKKCDEYKIGDIITYITDEGEPITHRIISIDEGVYYTKGDSNNIQDPKPVLFSQIYGKVIFHFNSFFSNTNFSFAKYINSNKHSINTQIAKPIFIVEGDKEIVIDKYGSTNDYQFSIKNFNNDSISEVSFNYSIEIIADEVVKTQLFHNGNLINTNDTFNLAHTTTSEHEYILKIEAPEDYTGKVKINVTAYQMEEVNS